MFELYLRFVLSHGFGVRCDHSFKILSAYYVSDTVLDTRHIAMKKTHNKNSLFTKGLHLVGGKAIVNK